MDLSPPGATNARDALDGVAMMPFGASEQHISRLSAADTVVIRYGGADALRGAAAQFERDLGAWRTGARG